MAFLCGSTLVKVGLPLLQVGTVAILHQTFKSDVKPKETNTDYFSGGDTTLRRRDSPVVICTPVFHLSGFFLMLIIAYVGNTSVIMEKFDMEEYLMHIEQLKVSILILLGCQFLTDYPMASEEPAVLVNHVTLTCNHGIVQIINL